jgi:hypothetical protein
MKRTFLDLPGWSFDIDEASAGVYQVIAVDEKGHVISKTGFDPELLIAESRFEASNIRSNSLNSYPSSEK